MLATEMSTEELRSVFGRFPTGVVLITSRHRNRAVGMAVNSFTSLSLEPPMILFCSGKSSTTWPDIRDAGFFCANILSADQEQFARQFSKRGVDRFAGAEYAETPTGAPVLAGVSAWIECRIAAQHDGGDHVIVVADVLSLGVTSHARPLVLHRGAYLNV